jgi:hypothetical protein
MKTMITAYTFTPSSRQITLTGRASVNLNQLLMIVNVTSGVIIYLYNDPTKGATVAGNVVTLIYDTTAMSAGDSLQIFLDVPDYNDGTSLFSGTISATGAGAAIDTSGFSAVIIQFSGVWSGLLFIEGSNDASDGSWGEMLLTSLDELSMQDAIGENGQYTVKTNTRYIRLNAIQLSGIITVSIVGRTSEGARAADRMALALDELSGIRMAVAVKNLSMDQYGALFLSDAIYPTTGAAGVANKVLFTIDTSGYQSIALQIFGTWAGTVTFQASNDGSNWVSVAGWNSATGSAAVATTTTNGLFSIPCVGKLFRAVETSYTSGSVQATAFLRSQPASPMIAPASPASVNAAQVGGTNVPSAGVAGVMPVGGNTTGGAIPTSYPVVVAGVDATGKVRRLLLDVLGQAVQPSIPAPANIQNLAAQVVMDVTQAEGQSIGELLTQIWIALKINNQYLFDLPRQLQSGSQASTSDEPDAFRNDPTYLRN